MRPDWHQEDVKAELRKTGATMAELSLKWGYCDAAVRRTLTRPWPKVEALIAEYLKRSPVDIWPSRYDAAGKPLKRPYRRRSSPDQSVPQRKTGEAA